MPWKHKDNQIIICLALLIFFSIIFFIWFVFREFNQGLGGGFDLAVYRQITWSTLRGKLLWSSLLGPYGSTDLMMHANITLLFLSPIFFIFDPLTTFLVIHAISLGIAALPVYLIAKEKINSRAGILFAIFYLTNTFTIQALIEGFQTRSLSVPIFFLTFYLLIKKRYFWLNLTLVLLCLTHEINCTVVFMLGIYVIFVHRRLKHGLIISFLSLGWFILVVKVIFAYFGNALPLMTLNFMVGEKLLFRASEIASYCFLHPVVILQRCLAQAKLDYFLRLFLPLGFLSLGSPVELAIGVPIFIQNIILSQDLVAVECPRYTMTLLPILFISAICSVAYLSKKFKFQWKYIEVFVVVCWSLSVSRFILDEGYNRRFKQVMAPISQETVVHWDALRRVSRLVPKDASVSADIRALPFLADRFELYDFPLHAEEVQYILIDKKEPSISSRVAISEQGYLEIIRGFISTGYRVVENIDDILLLKKGK